LKKKRKERIIRISISNFFSFFGNEFSFSNYYFKNLFKKLNERETEKEKEKECKRERKKKERQKEDKDKEMGIWIKNGGLKR